ncbi:hypothetical protein Ahy_A01g002632 [Arachis hypogaea]|uniref:DDE Tnp4 domain-containing protein n=1 Tax=Arachis hypogaea TaxID=3818 RepID=A0A445ERA0_ARAHY|nr:hypothetical protein Ahy_A01g002632 [Arachis hypogaea]
MNFVYVLSGWEGSASDSQILRDAITRCNSLKIPVGCYYLVDVGYTNGKGFLSPYRNVCYHFVTKFYCMNMDVDPEENATLLLEHIPVGDDTIVDKADTIDVVKSSHEWTQWREDLATDI